MSYGHSAATRITLVWVLLGCLLSADVAAQTQETAGKERTVVLDDFDRADHDWRFVGGQEFPGARGKLAFDAKTGHDRQGALRLDADFSGGGAYVGTWKELPDPNGRFLREIRLWVKARNVTNVGIRITDDTDQCHQTKNVRLARSDNWQELILPISDLVGSEHWGGANDGKWHGPPGGFGLNIGTDSLAEGDKGTLWLDDVAWTLGQEPPGTPTVLGCRLSESACRPGFGVDVTYRWDAVPMGRDYTVYVHFRRPGGGIAFQGDHTPPVATSAWSGRLEYEKTIIVPTDAVEGEYTITLGLYDPRAAKRGWDHPRLQTAQGAVAVQNDSTACRIGVLKVDAKAPLPKLGPVSLDLEGYRLTFDEDFKEPLSVSAWGPGTRWIAHTPYAGDFGDARFADPQEDFPFTIANGILRIEARKDEKGWRAGLLSSMDRQGNGFAQQYGYFEMRAKLPKGAGVWPAFWLLGAPQLRDKSLTQIEIDVLEAYGVNPNVMWTTVHLWHPDGKHSGDGKPFCVPGMTDGFHTYGVMVDQDFLTFYYDGAELWKVKTPDQARVPLYILVDLALGGGWPIDQTPNPSYMYVDYVRAYAK
ncbi:MAG: glycoside hydrolase family 16 protein [Sedimentisphaerales bacterium]|nr:glycoside hydrolase family 16 protein [Sedimentisphaerales bacterium]